MTTQVVEFVEPKTQKKSNNVANHLEPWLQLEGKVVFVTGASAGLGREFCLDLARSGCRVVAAARRADRLKSLCDEINTMTNSNSHVVRAVAIELDVTADGTTIEASVKKAWDAFGHIDALINNAGVRGGINSSVNLSEEEWKSTISTNLTGAWLVSKFMGRQMQATKRGGSIINISSISGLNRALMRGGIAYSSSKAAMDSMTKIMALELGEHNIRVNAIAPGLFKSEITEKLVQKDWLKNVATRTVPLKTFGTSDPALTSLVRYLVHDSSNYVSGNIFIVDAGYTLPGVPIFSSL
ncbi:putative transcription factor-like [Capsicum annuum]|nr:3-oxoacyl-[acyl-carrier-protein] reductase FabG [Capsicum annuum]KAF3665187.1 putative transcription factor-like [Capsicum annuum]KAF3671972.1 putative transcription factor-like [Capsicum annuum]